MARSRANAGRLLPLAVVALVVAGGLTLWLVRSPSREAPPTPIERAARQIEAASPGQVIRFSQQGATPNIVCGYVGPATLPRDEEGRNIRQLDQIFVSSPDGLLVQGSTPAEKLARAVDEQCPGFLIGPPPIVD